MVQTHSLSGKIVTVLAYLILTLLALSCLIPLVNTVAISFSDKAAVMASQVSFCPVRFTTAAYDRLLADRQYLVSFLNSVERVALGGAINFALTVLMAFPLSKGQRYFPRKNIYLWYIVFCMLFAGGLVPSYILISRLGLRNTIWSLVLPSGVPIFNVIVLMNYFKGLPEELDEAARLDGATPWISLARIYLPLSLPCLATITLFSVVGHWNAWFDGIIYIDRSVNMPLQSYLWQLTVEIQTTSTMSPEELHRMQELSAKNFNAAKVFVSMVPILCVYPFLQRFFVSGLVLGSVKG